MATRIQLKNPNTNQRRDAFIGFSWTTFFFGFWPAVFRGAWKWAFIHFILFALGLALTAGIGSFACWLYFCIKFNELHYKDLINDGFQEIQ